MIMSKRYVLLSGRSVATDDDLYDALQRLADGIRKLVVNQLFKLIWPMPERRTSLSSFIFLMPKLSDLCSFRRNSSIILS